MPDMIDRVRRDPAFAALEQRRAGFGWTLTALMLLIYFGFILTVAFAPDVLATPLIGVVPVGMPAGLFVIVSAIVLTGVYVWRANTHFDRLTDEIVGRAR